MSHRSSNNDSYAAKAHCTAFLSAVSNEFASYRREVCEALRQPGLWIESQENFLAFGTQTLVGLDDCIRKCDAVVQLVGQQAGATAPQASVDAIFERSPKLTQQLGVDEDFLRSLSYTQWEAWFALLHDKPLFLAPSRGASPDNELTGSVLGDQQRSTEAHISKLKEKEHYPADQMAFGNVDELKFVLQKNVLRFMELDEVRAAIEAQNGRFALVTNSELINQRQIPRDEVQAILEAADETADQGALLVAAAGFGKSCILAQVIEALRAADTPHLAVKLDSIPECGTAKAIGEELQLTESPVSAL